MKTALLLVGVMLVILGLHWIGQGTGLFIWPSNPAMNNHMTWAFFGAGAAIAGGLAIWFSRR